MTTKWDSFRGTLDRLHTDFEFPTATFENYENGEYNPDTGHISGGGWTSIGSLDVEFVPPQEDTSVDTEGTHLDFDTSIRVPTDDVDELSGELNIYGEGGEYATRVDVQGTVYETQATIPEHGSGMTLIRLTEI